MSILCIMKREKRVPKSVFLSFLLLFGGGFCWTKRRFDSLPALVMSKHCLVVPGLDFQDPAIVISL